MKLRTLEEQIGSRCKHFTGAMKPRCDAGIKYDDVRDPVRHGLPCFKGRMGGGKPCEKAAFPTDQEVAKEVREMRAGFERVKSARRVIVAHIEKTGELHGQVVCPACCKPLYYRQAKCNGHIHAKCETPDCTSWME